jgi:hypothetical protein
MVTSIPSSSSHPAYNRDIVWGGALDRFILNKPHLFSTLCSPIYMLFFTLYETIYQLNEQELIRYIQNGYPKESIRTFFMETHGHGFHELLAFTYELQSFPTFQPSSNLKFSLDQFQKEYGQSFSNKILTAFSVENIFVPYDESDGVNPEILKVNLGYSLLLQFWAINAISAYGNLRHPNDTASFIQDLETFLNQHLLQQVPPESFLHLMIQCELEKMLSTIASKFNAYQRYISSARQGLSFMIDLFEWNPDKPEASVLDCRAFDTMTASQIVNCPTFKECFLTLTHMQKMLVASLDECFDWVKNLQNLILFCLSGDPADIVTTMAKIHISDDFFSSFPQHIPSSSPEKVPPEFLSQLNRLEEQICFYSPSFHNSAFIRETSIRLFMRLFGYPSCESFYQDAARAFEAFKKGELRQTSRERLNPNQKA